MRDINVLYNRSPIALYQRISPMGGWCKSYVRRVTAVWNYKSSFRDQLCNAISKFLLALKRLVTLEPVVVAKALIMCGGFSFCCVSLYGCWGVKCCRTKWILWLNYGKRRQIYRAMHLDVIKIIRRLQINVSVSLVLHPVLFHSYEFWPIKSFFLSTRLTVRRGRQMVRTKKGHSGFGGFVDKMRSIIRQPACGYSSRNEKNT